MGFEEFEYFWLKILSVQNTYLNVHLLHKADSEVRICVVLYNVWFWPNHSINPLLLPKTVRY